MIYEPVDRDCPLAQGDLFRAVPRVDFSMEKLPVPTEDGGGFEELDWAAVVASSAPVAALLTIKPVLGIVISQNCDAARGESITLAQIDRYSEVIGSTPGTGSPGSTSERRWRSSSEGTHTTNGIP